MKISLNWLAEFVPVDQDAAGVARLCEQLTMLGFEVESVERLERGLPGVVCARVERVEPHPDADRLRLVTVDHGAAGSLTLVCGAPNVAEGLLVPLARLGARLPGLGNEPLKKAKIRGVVSEGMLCSDVELGLSDDHGGLKILAGDDWRPGRPLAEVYGLEDTVLDLEITQNRGDAFSILGVARDLAALNGWTLRRPALPAPERAPGDATAAISIDPDCTGCLRYAGQRLDGLRVGPSPRWLVDRLEAVGLRAINNVVDATNYVMWELGHPLHAFDWRQIRGATIRVRFAAEGEGFTTLDGQERRLGAGHTLICDGERPVALGGIMGGLNSGIEDDTTEILLECAAFDPVNIRLGARQAGLASDSSRRFERGVDPEDAAAVLARCAALLGQIAGARVAGEMVEAIRGPRPRVRVRVRTARVNALLGWSLPTDRIRRHAEALGATCESDGAGLWITAPSWRFDLEREVDWIEEVVRLEGYGQVAEARSARVPLGQRPNPRREFAARVRELAVRLGYQQVMNYSMVDPALLARVLPGQPALRIRNPLAEELSALRTSLLPSLLQAAAYNLNRRNDDLRLFEIDREFHPDAASGTGCRENLRLAMLLAGRRVPEHWAAPAAPASVHDLKETARALLNELQLDGLDWHPYLDRVFSANSLEIRIQGRSLGRLGQLDPLLGEELGLAQPIFLLDLDLDELAQRQANAVRYRPFSRRPSVWRDLSVVGPQESSAGQWLEAIEAAGRPLLAEVGVFDLYQGRGLAPGEISRSFRLRFSDPERPLADADVEPAVAAIVAALAERGARLRA
jgi:phenylalanyl-tRNA synthetase beta chain